MGTQSCPPTNKLGTYFVDQAVYEDDYCGLLETRSLPHTLPFSRPDCCPYILHKVNFGTFVFLFLKKKIKSAKCKMRQKYEIAETPWWKIHEIAIFKTLQLLQLWTWWKKLVFYSSFLFFRITFTYQGVADQKTSEILGTYDRLEKVWSHVRTSIWWSNEKN